MKKSVFLKKIISFLLVVILIVCSGALNVVWAVTLADYSKLDKVVATIPDGPNRTNGVYKAEELEALDEMVTSFDRNLTSEDQEIVNLYRSDLSEAINNLSMDLSRAVAKVTVLLDRKFVKKDDIITVIIKIDANYPVTSAQIPVLFDKTKFTLIDYESGNSFINFCDSSFKSGSYDLNGNAGIKTGFSNTSNSEKWDTDEIRAKYDYAWFTISFNSQKNPSNLNLAVPQDEDFATFRLQATENIENAEELVFISPDWIKTEKNKSGTFYVGFSGTVLNRNPATYHVYGMTYKLVTDSMIPTDSISLNMTEAILTLDKPTVQLVATVTPETAINRNITWTSSDTSVATVDSTGMVTRVGTGETVITAETPYGQVAMCKITVIHQCFAELTFYEAKEADCYTDGNESYYECTCGKLYSDSAALNEVKKEDVILPALNHPADGVYKTEYRAPTHTVNGSIEYWFCDYCSECFRDEACTEKIEGLTVIPATGHDDLTDAEWLSNETSHYKKCSCGKKFETSTHTFEWIRESEPTCTDSGSKYEKCTVCGFIKSEKTPIGVLSHTLQFVEGKEANCTEQGNISYYECSVCSKLFRDEEGTEEITIEETKLSPEGHSFIWITECVPTCTDSGSQYEKCTVCGFVRNENTPIDVLPHTTEYIEGKEATCTEKGNISYYECSVCFKLFSDGECTKEITIDETELPLADHSYESIVIPSTPTENGYTTYICSVCGNSYNSDYTEPGIKVEGIVKTSAFEEDEVTLTLFKKGENAPVDILKFTGNEVSYCFSNITAGDYTIEVSKNNHISQNFDFTVVDEEKITMDLTLFALGDVNCDSKVTVADYAQVLSHVKMLSKIDSEKLVYADVNQDSKITVSDYAQILRHVKKIFSIWK